MKPTVLLYNFTKEELAAWQGVAQAAPGVTLRPVEKREYGLPLSTLLAGTAPHALYNTAPAFSARMAVFADMEGALLDTLLAAARTVTPHPVLRAMATPTNRTWNSATLYDNLAEEEETMRRFAALNREAESKYPL